MIIWLALTWFSCSNVGNIEDVNIINDDKALAFPLINSNLNIINILGDFNDQTYVEVKPDGKLVVHYNGDVNKKTASDVFPPILIGKYWEIPDTTFNVPMGVITDILTTDKDIIVTKSQYKNNHIKFEYTSSFDEPISVKMKIPGMTKDGKEFEVNTNLNPNVTAFETENISIDDWTLEAYNIIPFVYDARKSNGERVKLDKVRVKMDTFRVKYTEGYFGQNRLPIKSDRIEIGVFNKWKSGGFKFEDPTIILDVDNSFGFLVKARINYLIFTTINGADFALTGEHNSEPIFFDHPALGHAGEVINTKYIFDKNNSNIKELFNDKVIRFSYDIDASANPYGDSSKIGFVDEESYFKVSSSVILPLEMTIDNLVLVDTIRVSLDRNKTDISSAQFKLVNQNRMPFDIGLQCYFIDYNSKKIDSLFEGTGMSMPAATKDDQGNIIPGEEITSYIDIDKNRYNNINKATKFVIEVGVKSIEGSDKSVWITKDHGLLTKLGVIVKTEEK